MRHHHQLRWQWQRKRRLCGWRTVDVLHTIPFRGRPRGCGIPIIPSSTGNAAVVGAANGSSIQGPCWCQRAPPPSAATVAAAAQAPALAVRSAPIGCQLQVAWLAHRRHASGHLLPRPPTILRHSNHTLLGRERRGRGSRQRGCRMYGLGHRLHRLADWRLIGCYGCWRGRGRGCCCWLPLRHREDAARSFYILRTALAVPPVHSSRIAACVVQSEHRILRKSPTRSSRSLQNIILYLLSTI